MATPWIRPRQATAEPDITPICCILVHYPHLASSGSKTIIAEHRGYAYVHFQASRILSI